METSLFAQLKKVTEEHPRITSTTLRARASWDGNLRAKAKVRQHRAFPLDELRYLGGGDSGPNPIEHFLAAFGGCICILGSALAREMGLDVRGLEAEGEGTLDVRGFLAEDGITSQFRTVKARVLVATNETQEQIDRLKVEFERRCPFHTMLVNAGTALDSQWEAIRPRGRGQRETCPGQ